MTRKISQRLCIILRNVSKSQWCQFNSINIIGNLGEFFRTAKPEVKILLLGSIFPQKIELTGCLKSYIRKPTNCMGEEMKNPLKNQRTSVRYPRPFCSRTSLWLTLNVYGR